MTNLQGDMKSGPMLLQLSQTLNVFLQMFKILRFLKKIFIQRQSVRICKIVDFAKNGQKMTNLQANIKSGATLMQLSKILTLFSIKIFKNVALFENKIS